MESLSPAVQALRAGGTVVFPTETVYGLGARALDAAAVAKIFEIKRRPRFNPLIVHLPSRESLATVAAEVPDAARRLADAFWPGPLTLVLPKRPEIPDLVTAGLSTVGVRMPAHPVAIALLEALGEPIAAPSANRFTRLSPTCIEHAREQLGDEVDCYLDGGPCAVGVESTIVGWIDGQATLLRKGGTPVEAIEAVIGRLAPIPVIARPLAPGMLEKHYAPTTPLFFSDKPIVFEKARRVGLLTLSPNDETDPGYAAIEYLSRQGDLREAAQRLFGKLREMEDMHLDLIVARPVPNTGLGGAINDRLRRAGLDS